MNTYDEFTVTRQTCYCNPAYIRALNKIFGTGGNAKSRRLRRRRILNLRTYWYMTLPKKNNSAFGVDSHKSDDTSSTFRLETTPS